MEQLSLFEATLPQYKITKPIRLIELFGGIGAQAKALERLKANFTHYKLIEYDIHPVKSYNAIHNTNFETLDITKIHAEDLQVRERERWEYIMTYSFPCQDLSLAGKGRGMKKGSSTRSGLLWEVERLLIELKENLPQILLMENVPQVIGTKNIKDFNLWVQFLESKGYKNYIQVLNSKNYGIPQNRERCFMVSILGNYSYTFPKEKKLDKTLLDLLEPEPVDESYYLSDKQIKNITEWKSQSKILVKNATKKGYLEAEEGDGVDISNRMETHRGTVQKGMTQTIKTQCENGVVVGTYQYSKSDNFMKGRDRFNKGKVIADCIQTTPKEGVVIKDKSDQMIKVGNWCPSGHSAGIIYDPKGIAPTTMDNHSTTTTILVKEPQESKVVAGFGKKGKTNQYHLQNRVYEGDITTSITASFNHYYKTSLRIRKLTPLECWRLMGFDDEDYQKASKVNSKSQLYKQAGNSIVVNVLEAIFKQLL